MSKLLSKAFAVSESTKMTVTVKKETEDTLELLAGFLTAHAERQLAAMVANRPDRAKMKAAKFDKAAALDELVAAAVEELPGFEHFIRTGQLPADEKSTKK